RLAERLDQSPDLKVTFCLDVSRKGTDTSRDEELLDRYANEFVQSNWSGTRLPGVYFDPRGLSRDGASRAVLHAKCIVVDNKSALITSANPTPAAYERNIEVGLVLRGGDLPAQLSAHFSSLIERGLLKPLGLPQRKIDRK